MIREIHADEFHKLWPIFQAVIATGEAFAQSSDTTEAEACASWTTPPTRCFVFERDGQVLGGYSMKPNQPGHGSHVANAGYIVAPEARGQGIAGQLCEHSLQTARDAGFLAMQFNIVVSTNEVAVRLWQKHGFEIVGRVPKAFRHARLGLTDVYVMHRFL